MVNKGFTVKIEKDNINDIINAKNEAVTRALEEIGISAEKFAKALCPVGTSESTGKKGYRGGTLRNSITHKAEGDLVIIGSNVEYAPFVELGTGPYFVPPPEWETFKPYERHGGGHGYVHPRPYLRPAIEHHLEDYKHIIESELG